MCDTRKHRSALSVAVISIATCLVLFGLSTPAQAHDSSVGGPWRCGWSGLQYCGYGGVSSNHTWAYACDQNADGQSYYIHWQRNVSTEEGGTVFDGNGSAEGCGGATVGPVHRFRMCTYTVPPPNPVSRCTEWHLA